MTKTTGIILGLVLVLLFLGGMFYMAKFNIKKDAGQLKNAYNAQLKVNENRFASMWKIIKTEAQVPEKYKDAIKEVLVANNTSKYGANGRQEGGFMNVLQEANPNFNDAMYQKLMNLIEGEMKAFERDQNTLIAISQQYNDLMLTWTAQMFLEDLTPMDAQIVTSTKTKKAFATGVDDDTDIFEDKKDTSAVKK
jgi:hypothetical protein